MCGFITFTNFYKRSAHNADFLKLKNINKHRGPDSIKLTTLNNHNILFRRLKIIDLSDKADQPFESKNPDIQMVFNGEVYNYLEIKKELKKFKINFNTNSDTEVILKSYVKWGIDFVNKLRGMFSIVIFDNKQKKILFFRDHFGQKPLFYSLHDKGLIISSEIKDILFIKKKYELNRKIINKYLIRGWTDDTDETFFKNIHSLPAGSFGEYSKKEFKIKKYWKLEYKNNIYHKDELREVFEKNIKLHLRSDVPLAFTLSSGMDSSSILRTALKFNIKKYKAFSLKTNYDNETDETKIIKKFVNKYGLNHQFLRFDYNDYNNVLEDLIQYQDEPINHPSFVYQYLLRKEISKQGFKVLLTGEGGDEVFGGYTRMYIPYIIENFFKTGNQINKTIINNINKISNGNQEKILKNSINIYENYQKIQNDIEDKNIFKVLNTNILKLNKNLKFYNDSNPYDENYYKNFLCNHLNLRDLPNILRQEDRISMSQSIENRSPMVDHKLIEYVFSLKSSYFMKNGTTKYLLKDIMKDQLPVDFITNKKIPRPGAYSNIIYSNYREKFIDLLNKKNFNSNLFNNDKIKNILLKKNKIHNYDPTLFRILNILIWNDSLNSKINF